MRFLHLVGWLSLGSSPAYGTSQVNHGMTYGVASNQGNPQNGGVPFDFPSPPNTGHPQIPPSCARRLATGLGPALEVLQGIFLQEVGEGPGPKQATAGFDILRQTWSKRWG